MTASGPRTLAEQAVLVEALTRIAKQNIFIDGGSSRELQDVAKAAVQSAPEAAVKMLAVVEAAVRYINWPTKADWDDKPPDAGAGTWFSAGEMKNYNILVDRVKALSALTETKDTSDGARD